MNPKEKRMLDILVEGKARYGICAVKAEFEAEGTRTDELLRLLEIARRAGVKVALKIGGCEAVRDLIECRQFGVDYIIAPMIETPYALTKFIAAKNKVYPREERGEIAFLFNVETISTYQNLAEMAAIAGKGDVGMVFGRVDFAGSVNKDRAFVNSDEMTNHIVKVAEAAASAGVDLVVGGAVSPESIPALRRVQRAKLSRFETRKVIFDAAVLDGNATEGGLALAIEFELLWLKNKRDYYMVIGSEDEKRIEMMEERQAIKAAARAAA